MKGRTAFFLFVFAVAAVAALFGYFFGDARQEARPASTAPQVATTSLSVQETAGPHSVMYTVDGDTVFVSVDGRRESVRLLGIDTPEVATPDNPASECYGAEAQAFLRERLRGKEVYLVADAQADNRDEYNRLLRYLVLPDGTHVNALLLKEGYAEVFRSKPFTLKPAFLEYEAEAREEKRGRWGVCR